MPGTELEFGAAVALTGCRGWETENRPVHLIKNMDTQEKGKAYRRDTTGLFADGRMMRAPVEGTVAQGQLADDALGGDFQDVGKRRVGLVAALVPGDDHHVFRGGGGGHAD